MVDACVSVQPFPNGGRPPFVPLPPVDGRVLSLGSGGPAGSSTPNIAAKNPRFAAPNVPVAENPASLKVSFSIGFVFVGSCSECSIRVCVCVSGCSSDSTGVSGAITGC